VFGCYTCTATSRGKVRRGPRSGPRWRRASHLRESRAAALVLVQLPEGAGGSRSDGRGDSGGEVPGERGERRRRFVG
jgi:hypothetical protein